MHHGDIFVIIYFIYPGFELHQVSLQYRRFCLLSSTRTNRTWSSPSFCSQPDISSLLQILLEGRRHSAMATC